MLLVIVGSSSTRRYTTIYSKRFVLKEGLEFLNVGYIVLFVGFHNSSLLSQSYNTFKDVHDERERREGQKI